MDVLAPVVALAVSVLILTGVVVHRLRERSRDRAHRQALLDQALADYLRRRAGRRKTW